MESFTVAMLANLLLILFVLQARGTTTEAETTAATTATEAETTAATTATEAETTATEADTTATEADSTATEADTTATEADTTATEADTTATEADTTATEDDTTATETDTTATEADTTATEADTTATEADTILQCYSCMTYSITDVCSTADDIASGSGVLTSTCSEGQSCWTKHYENSSYTVVSRGCIDEPCIDLHEGGGPYCTMANGATNCTSCCTASKCNDNNSNSEGLTSSCVTWLTSLFSVVIMLITYRT
ncbi:uncharacterized protein LOC105439524 [Strongylocentrotus purpuratus]|uniref:Uncharacterized protein n=1 Tax=Strongylocentrotus purpuratus TaxID=7668 RepID=A0A7M7HK61_STRPU|nr:uncharacterized protein LOC105439524 [Strongylocentrotus purpuratus]|eukprot:XP_011666923.1 PREDICTED: uncharacterized protein LOC105439524 [Strongylocentrotus purpuratus]